MKYQMDLNNEETSIGGDNHNSTPFDYDNEWHYFPKVDVKTFDRSEPIKWVTQMEHYFSLHGITSDMMKLRVGVLYLDQEHWKWWQ
jgi:hypothetical protein